MKLFRFGAKQRERPGLVASDGSLRDVSAIAEDYDERFLESGGLERLASLARDGLEACPLVPKGARLGPCIARPCKIVCVGRNYPAHAAETGAELPKEPLLFMKAPSALSGPYDDVVLPPGATKADWEVELAVVIGRAARHVSREQALEYVAGFALFNDYTERAFQKERSGQWTKGKSADSFAPIGPYLVTPDAIRAAAVELRLSVNGVERQRASTAEMHFDVPTLIAYVSEFMTLLPGDVLSTGTPDGVGMGQRPPLFLAPGDIVEYGAEGLGSARQRVVAWQGGAA
jgi:2-keto-4-pentenoate hydratase/2-oxohepta-3-ene-1,7-dioic acid hydratase in catechol pathway